MTLADDGTRHSHEHETGCPTVSVVVPAFNEEGNIETLVLELERVLGNEDHEIVLVDDGSTDGTLSEISRVRRDHPSVDYIALSRNFGHQNAIKAGIDSARGACVVTIDADLQHPPELISRMLELWRGGADVVNTVRQPNGTQTLIKRATSRLFYSVLNLVSEVRIQEGTADFRLLDRAVVDVLKDLDEDGLFYRGLIPWMGFRTAGIPYRPARRHAGRTKYSVSRMFAFAVSGIVSFSILPLRLATVLGWLMALGGFAVGAKAVFDFLFTDNAVPGWASTIVAVVLVGGIQLIVLGIIGEYVGRLFMQSKRRPHYIVRETSRRRVPACR